MKIPRDQLGRDLALVLCSIWGYQKVNQVGSHIIFRLRRRGIIVFLFLIISR